MIPLIPLIAKLLKLMLLKRLWVPVVDNYSIIEEQMSSPIFEEVLAEVLGIEGGYSDTPADRGGKTNWGVTETLARAYDYTGPMHELPLGEAKRIYQAEFWDNHRLQLDVIAEISGPVAAEIFEQAVNTGTKRTAVRVQRVLNVLNRDEKLYPDLKLDGLLWNNARSAIQTLMAKDNGQYLLQWLNVAQGAHYLWLCESDPTQETFARGWIDKRVKI